MSADSVEKLVYMANQIARNLMHEPDPAAATAAHIEAFWSPRMKTQIFDCVGWWRAGAGGVGGIAGALLQNTDSLNVKETGRRGEIAPHSRLLPFSLPLLHLYYNGMYQARTLNFGARRWRARHEGRKGKRRATR